MNREKQMHMMWKLGLTVVTLAFLPFSAGATDVTVKVPGKTMPWSQEANPQLPFGKNDGAPPVVIPLPDVQAGEKVVVIAEGWTTPLRGGEHFGPAGQKDFVTNDTPGNSGTFFPSRLIAPEQFPVHLNQLIGCFIDAEGKLVARPFAVETERAVNKPAKAVAIAFGINDDIYAENEGELLVRVVSAGAPAN
jgi:hypothetical protein